VNAGRAGPGRLVRREGIDGAGKITLPAVPGHCPRRHRHRAGSPALNVTDLTVPQTAAALARLVRDRFADL
jgi:hypothetical protein